jgi:hypothetical protein
MGEEELDIYRFEKIPQNYLFQESPWQVLFINSDVGPIGECY